jgi:predicted transcriptional regulator
MKWLDSRRISIVLVFWQITSKHQTKGIWNLFLLLTIKKVGRKRMENLSETKTENNRNYKGFNLFSKFDLAILISILRGEYNISGFRNKHLQKQLGLNGNKISRLIKRLRIHGLIKRATDSYKYYITKLGKETIIMAQKIKELVIVPAFSY